MWDMKPSSLDFLKKDMHVWIIEWETTTEESVKDNSAGPDVGGVAVVCGAL